MAGLTDLASADYLNYIAGAKLPALVGTTVALGLVPPPEFLGLFTTAPTSDAGVTGATEASGGTYARLQVAGAATTNGTTASGNATLHFAATPAWIWNGSACIATGFYIYDATSPAVIPAGTYILSATGTTVTMSANAAGAGVGATDIIAFSAFGTPTASSGSEPAATAGSMTNPQAVLNFIQSTTNLGTIVAAGLFDAVTSGNCRWWDWLGAGAWKPFTVSSASPGVITCPAHGFSAGQAFVVSQKDGGALPSFSQSNFTNAVGTLITVAIGADSFSATNAATAVNTSSSGSGLLRAIAPQSVPNNITVTFPVNSITLSLG